MTSSEDILKAFLGSTNDIREFFQKIAPDIEEYVITIPKAPSKQDIELEEQIETPEAEAKLESEPEQERVIRIDVSDLDDTVIEEIKLDVRDSIKILSDKSVASLDLEQLTIHEILDKLKCRCRDHLENLARVMRSKQVEWIQLEEEKLEPKQLKEEILKEEILEEEILEEETSEDESETEKTSERSLVSKFILTSETKKSIEVESSYGFDQLRDQDLNLNEFLSVKEYACVFIDDVLEEAIGQVDVKIATLSSIMDEESYSSALLSIFTKIRFLSIEDFTLNRGHELIKDIVHTWELTRIWSYCINFLSESSDPCAEYYIYEVKWSIPTKCYPIPQVTVSVFFVLQVSRVIPPMCPVKVNFTFETEQYEFSMFDKIQHEKFLLEIYQNKMSFFKKIRF